MTEVKDQNLRAYFAEVYESHKDAIFRYCLYKTGNREGALDLTADTFAKTWEYILSDKDVENIRAFLYRVANNLVIDSHRKKKSSSLDNLLESGFDFPEDRDEEEIHETSFEAKKAIEIINKLDEKYRDAMILRYVNDLSVKEIATILGENENSISVRIHRGLEKLKSIL